MKLKGKVLLTFALMGTLHTLQGSSYPPTTYQVAPLSSVRPATIDVISDQVKAAASTTDTGIIISNESDYPVDYEINRVITGRCTFLSITEGELTGGGLLTFKKGMFSKPKQVCVWVTGQTSIGGRGGFTRIKNGDRTKILPEEKTCIITVKNGGLFQGIDLYYSTGCQANGVNGPVALTD